MHLEKTLGQQLWYTTLIDSEKKKHFKKSIFTNLYKINCHNIKSAYTCTARNMLE